MASSSLYPPAIVHVASNLSENNQARPRSPSSCYLDEDDDLDDEDCQNHLLIHEEAASVAWTDSPLSSCPNSPHLTPHGNADDDDDDDDDVVVQQPANVSSLLLDVSSRAVATSVAYALSRQDSKLGRESRLERLKLEHQSRFAQQLEEK